MVKVRTVQKYGSQLLVILDDGTRHLAYPTPNGMWVAAGTAGGGTPGGGSGLVNPWGTTLSVGGDWETHVANTTRGGADWPLSYGTPLTAPASGTLQSHETGAGTSDLDTGDVGQAGLRSILFLDTPVARVQPAGTNEAAGPMTAIVFQHQSSMGGDGHYNKGDVVGASGNSGNGVTHLHVHGLDASGNRVDFLKFF